MVILGRGWIWVGSLLVLGGKVEAQITPSTSNAAGTTPISDSATNTPTSSSSTSGSSSLTPSASLPTVNSESIIPSILRINEQPVPNHPQPTSGSIQAHDTLHAKWRVPGQAIVLNTEATFAYELDAEFAAGLKLSGDSFGAVLVRTVATTGEPLTSLNSWSVLQLIPCQNGNCREMVGKCPRGAVCGNGLFNEIETEIPGEDKWSYTSWMFQHDENLPLVSSDVFFACFGSSPASGGFECHVASDFFKFTSNSKGPLEESIPNISALPAKPTAPLALTPGPAVVTYKGVPSSLLPTSSTVISSEITITKPSALPTSTDTAGVTPSGSNSTRNSGLSTGAIVGIAIGSFVVVSLLALLALFFCIRRRRRAQSGTTHEQAMLTRSHPEGSSRDHLAEKDNTVRTLIHPNSNDSSFLFPDQNDTAARQTLIPIGTAYGGPADQNTDEFRDAETRNIHTSSYEPAPVASIVAPVFAVASSPPRRKPTNASTASAGAVSALSRNTSSATTASTASYGEYPVHSQLQNIGEEGNSPTNGESQARYGETPRHFPQISDRGSSASPFLSEPGMSAEEIARLDEEERRIDAAIAAADEQRERDRSGSGLR